MAMMPLQIFQHLALKFPTFGAKIDASGDIKT
jgi:hypothetical protein